MFHILRIFTKYAGNISIENKEKKNGEKGQIIQKEYI